MVKKRPQLNLDELQRLKWLLGGVLALISLSALLYLELDAWVLMAAGFVAVPLVLVRPDLPAYIPAWLHRLVFPGALAVSIYDFYAHAEPLPTLVRLAVFLLLYRACGYRRRRDDLQLVVLGLFPIVMAGVLTVSLAFAVQIVAFVACALLFLLLVTVTEAQLSGSPVASVAAMAGAPAWTQGGWRPLARRVRAAADWRLFILGGLLFAALVALSALLFLAIPRFQLESGFFLDRLLTRKSSTGFSDTLKFDDVIAIQQDNGVALRVEVSDRNRMPSVIYWRMVVLDEYRNGTFRLSAALKRSAFERETTGLRVRGSGALVRGGPLLWTFYLEPGVSRYLALAGGFSRLVFTEPQVYRRSPTLSLVELGRDPLAMKAYRVEGMQAGAVLQDLGSDALPAPTLATEDAPANPMLQLALDANDRAALANAVREITGGAGLSAEAFANAAMMWLAKKHAYSLDIELPKGAGDPLVRWLTSDRPGHCELFAGAFALLARAAGYPTRLVAGFMGGTWNDDYLIVRNSDAHAWCEIFDGGGRWLRVDPTNDGPRLLAGDRAGDTARAANLRPGAHSWASRLDRLRLLWYRRIVNFDRGDQQELVQAFKLKVASSGHLLRVWLERSAEHVKNWFTRPWDVRRWGRTLGFAVAVAAMVWTLWRFGPGWWRRVRGSWRVGRSDPVRREAGRWLQRLDSLGQVGGCAGVRDDLLRVRYGPRESWSAPARVFAEARKAERALRRRARH